MRSILIAAPKSGCGKTTLSRGLISLCRRRGYVVQPFKCGPDYIDTKMHGAGVRGSVNLDPFFSSADDLRRLYAHYSQGADVCVVEGMMGLFDGYDGCRGSCAEIALSLGLSVVLVVDARASAYTVTPMLQGLRHFDPDLHIEGVIFNMVGSERHEKILSRACGDAGLKCFGCVPRSKGVEQSSRYLGLDFSRMKDDDEELVEIIAKHVEWKRLLDLPMRCSATPDTAPPRGILSAGVWGDFAGGNISIAFNAESFSFVYRQTIDYLSDCGKVTFFDPERDETLPAGTDFLYLPGGYPEKHAEALCRAESARRSITVYARGGGRVLAECGGMMYLSRSILTDDGEYPMCGVLPYRVTARAADRRLSLGYRRFVLGGYSLRGHEFHYSQFPDGVPASDVQVYDARGNDVPTPVFRVKNVLASYTHLYLCRVTRLGGDHPSSRPALPAGAFSPVMIAGTGSGVGKSVLVAALCRIFLQDGLRPAPFKAQNMALNSYATADGREMGRAQAMQAEAARLTPQSDMNPLLLKPNQDHTSQIVLGGRVVGTQQAYDYLRESPERALLRQAVRDAFDRLSARYNPIVMEGAGSIAEINLRDTDLVNMPMADYARAKVILVGDIELGGVFGSLYGSVMLLRPGERAQIKGIIINKFRGDRRLFEEGRKEIERLCGIPVLGIIPYFDDISLDEEDSMDLREKSRHALQGKVNIAVALLPHISNYTDFDRLERDPRVHVYYTASAEELERGDIIILPGTKSTVADLRWLRDTAMAQVVTRAAAEGKTVLGICGGYQMMGRRITDPCHVEGDDEDVPGLALLPVSTTMTGVKTTRQTKVRFVGATGTPGGQWLLGYEIHMGETTGGEPLFITDDHRYDGCRLTERLMGTYIHGILDNDDFTDFLLSPYTESRRSQASGSARDYKEEQYDRLADMVRAHLDIKRLYGIMRL